MGIKHRRLDQRDCGRWQPSIEVGLNFSSNAAANVFQFFAALLAKAGEHVKAHLRVKDGLSDRLKG